MLSSLDYSTKVSTSKAEKYLAKTPKSKRIVLRSESKRHPSRAKTRKSNLKISTNQLTQKDSSIYFPQKMPITISSSKNTSGKFKLNSPTVKIRKSSSRLFSNGSNRSLRISGSPKNSRSIVEKPDFPMTPAKILNFFRHELTSFEQGEILKYSEIFFIGTIKNKLKPRPEQENYGFDDKNSDYLLVKNDHIAYRYEIIDLLGKGSFGQVCQCYDHKRKENVALKIIKNKPKFHQQATIEVKILHAIRESDQENNKNIIRMKNYFSFRSHICITFELVSINLYDLLQLNNFNGISLNLIKCFAKQLLCALEYIGSLEIVHCDLKPENVLLVNPHKANIKLIDFGSSCFLPEKIHTYIQSRFYRAPEIMLGIPYTCAIDMWSLGCILVELMTGQPLWPGESEKDQLLLIISFLGLPPEKVLENSQRKNLFFEEGKLKTNQLSDGKTIVPSSKKMQDVISAEKDFFDFISKCFTWDPEQRMSPSEALVHSWILNQKPSKSAFLDKKYLS